MSRLELTVGKKFLDKEGRMGKIFRKDTLMVSFIGFLLGRVFLFCEMNPMVIAYYGVFASKSNYRFYLFISTVLGLLTMGNTLYGVKYISILLVMTILLSYGETKKKSFPLMGQAIIGGLLTFSMGVGIAFLNGILSYYLLLSLLESILVFSLTLIYGKGEDIVTGSWKRSQFSQEEIVGFAILVSSAIAGIGEFSVIGVSFTAWISTIIIFSVAYHGGPAMGCVMGTLLGTILVLGGYEGSWIIGAFSAAGMMGGLFKQLGKLGVAIGFTLGSGIFMFYFHGKELDASLVKAFILAIPGFMILPDSWLDKVCKNISFENDLEQEAYIRRIATMTKEKLQDFSHAFQTLANTFTHLSHKRSTLTHEEVSKLFDDIASAVCSDCGLCSHCWESDFYYTYQTVFSILGAAEKKGKVEQSDIPKDFLNRCVKAEEFIATTNQFFEIYKLNLTWHNRIIESRELVSQQLYGVASIMDRLSRDVHMEIQFDKYWEEKLRVELDRNQIPVRDVIVFENPVGRYEIHLQCKSCNGKRDCIRKILPVLQKNLGRPIKPHHTHCITEPISNLCTLRFIEEEKYKLTMGMARAIKEHNTISGDNYTFLELKSGQSLLALSDGMGGGEKAHEESAAAIELLEQFMDSGFDKDIAVKMINSVLVLKSSEEAFSTLDMCVIDLYTGLCELIKIGAASTFIKREDRIEMIKSTSLPVGILSHVDIDVNRKMLKSGDMIIMVTDGVLDSKEGLLEKEVWIEKALQNFEGHNPQDLADYLLEQAKINSQGKIKDDMTVLVARVWRNYERT